MYIEELKKQGLLERLFEVVMEQACGVTKCVSTSGMNVEHPNLIAKAYDLKKNQKMFVYCKSAKMVDAGNKKEVFYEGLTIKGKGKVFGVEDAKIMFEVDDFNINFFASPKFDFENVQVANVQKAYVNFMYDLFGEEYKKAFIKARKEQQSQLLRNYKNQTKNIFDAQK